MICYSPLIKLSNSMKKSIIYRNSIVLIAVLLFGSTLSCRQENSSQNTENKEDKKIEVGSLTKVSAFGGAPLAGIDVPFSSYEIEASQANTLKYINGSQIEIPANIFVDASGKEVSGKVQIRYREMHNPYEILVSGIPMAVKDNENDGQLESAGMLEILAEQGGQVLRLKADNSIKITMVSEQRDNNHNLYYLDTTNKSWIEKQQNLAVVPFALKKATNSAGLSGNIREKAAAEMLPVKPQVAQKQRFQFKVKLDLQTYPELSAYDGIEWEYADTDSSKDPINNPWVTNSQWLSMKLERTKKSGIYIITLNNGARSYSAKVRPVFDAADVGDAQALYDEKYKAYLSYVTKKEKLEKEAVERKANREKTEDLLTKVSRTFEITALGVWNCDRIVNDVETAAIANATFSFEGEARQTAKVYLIDQAINSVYYAYSLPKVNFNPKHENTLLVISTKGELGLYTPREFKKLKGGKSSHEFKLKRIGYKATTAKALEDELKKYM